MLYSILFFGFLTIVLLIVGMYSLLFQSRLATLERLVETDRLLEPDNNDTQSHAIGERKVGIINLISKIFRSGKYMEKIRTKLLQAYIKMKPEEFIAISITLGILIGAILFLQGRNALLFILGFTIGFKVPDVFVGNIKKKRSQMLNKQLPQALSIISNGLRAGFSFTQAMNVASKDLETPISDEFSKVLRDNSLGKPLDEALENLTKRTDDEDLDMLVTALLIQRQVGGNLAEVLDTISETIRERVKLKGEIRTLTSQGKMEAWVIGVLPVGIAAIIAVINPSYIKPLFNHPVGLAMLGAAVIMMGIGIFILTRLVDVKV